MQKLVVRDFIQHFILVQIEYLLQANNRFHIIILVNKCGIAKFMDNLRRNPFSELDSPLLLKGMALLA